MLGRGGGRGPHEPSGARRLAPVAWGVAALAVVILAYLTSEPRATRTAPERWLLDGLAPAQGVLVRLSRRFADALGALGQLGRLRQENEALRRQVNDLRLQLTLLSGVAAENRQLRAALKLQAPASWNLLACEVIQRRPTRWYAQVVVNRGEQDGVTLNVAAITAGGVVGHVVAVSAHTATVQLITDVEASIGGEVVRTGDLVLVEGIDGGTELRVKSLSGQAGFQEGDLVVTSGLGGVYPKGLLVGTIRQAWELAGGLGREGRLSPAADLDRLHFVYLLLAPAARR